MNNALVARLLDVRVVGAIVGTLIAIYAFAPRDQWFGAGMLPGQFIIELLPGAFVGVSALSLVLIYRTVRIPNFAQAAFAVIAPQLFYEFYTRGLMPYGLAWPVGIAGGTLVVVVLGIILSTLFFNHPRLTLTIVSVFATSIIGFASDEINGAFQKPGETLTVQPIPAQGSFADGTVLQVGVVPIRIAHLIGLLAIAGVIAGLTIFMRRSRLGVAVRAAAENADRASLLGINVKLLNVGVWAIVGLITSVAAIAQMPVIPYAPGTGANVAFETLLAPFAAAILARFTSLPVAFLAGLGIHFFRVAVFLDTSEASQVEIVLVAIVIAGLLLQRRKYSRVDDATSWKSVREIRSTPSELLRLPAVRRSRRAIFAVLAIVVLGLPFVVSGETGGAYASLWSFATILTSLVILTGWTGQLSLGHTALVGIGAIAAGQAGIQLGLPFLLTLPVGGLAGAALAVVVGLPALRIRGLFLGIATFAIGVVFPTLFFGDRYLASWLPQDVTPFQLFGFGFVDVKFAYYFQLVLFLLVAAAVRTLRKSRAGRLLIALRDNEQGVQAFGVDIIRTRLMAFAISGFIAGIAGAVLVQVFLGLDRQIYSAQSGFFLFQLIIIGGVSTVVGAVLGGLVFVLGTQIFPNLLQLLSGIGGLMLLIMAPGGLAQIFFGMRDGVLRVVALRRHIVVPSLFADYSPEAWEQRLTPLAPTVPSQGLGALPADQRYALESRLYGKVRHEPTSA